MTTSIRQHSVVGNEHLEQCLEVATESKNDADSTRPSASGAVRFADQDFKSKKVLHDRARLPVSVETIEWDLLRERPLYAWTANVCTLLPHGDEPDQ